jgi:hypothetical protein
MAISIRHAAAGHHRGDKRETPPLGNFSENVSYTITVA